MPVYLYILFCYIYPSICHQARARQFLMFIGLFIQAPCSFLLPHSCTLLLERFKDFRACVHWRGLTYKTVGHLCSVVDFACSMPEVGTTYFLVALSLLLLFKKAHRTSHCSAIFVPLTHYRANIIKKEFKVMRGEAALISLATFEIHVSAQSIPTQTRKLSHRQPLIFQYYN